MRNRVSKSYKILMVKKFADSITNYEQIKLDKYIEKNEAALLYFLELKKFWILIESCFLMKNHQTDLKKEWEKLIESIENMHNRH